MFNENKYQAGKIILKTKMSSPISARLSEFGWEPIYEFLDRQRVNYFAIFDELPAHMLLEMEFPQISHAVTYSVKGNNKC